MVAPTRSRVTASLWFHAKIVVAINGGDTDTGARAEHVEGAARSLSLLFDVHDAIHINIQFVCTRTKTFDSRVLAKDNVMGTCENSI